MKLFEYAVLYVPPQNQSPNESKKKDDEPKILVKPTHCMASDLSQAQIMAARAIPEEYIGRLQHVQLAVRPF